MSYLDKKKKFEEFKEKKDESLKSYEQAFLSSKPPSLEEIKEQAMEFLYSDLIESNVDYEFRSSLGNGQYTAANKEAISCLELSITARELFPKRIPDWVEHSQKCFDYLLVKYISDGLEEKVEKQKGKDYETDIYVHLEEKKEDGLNRIGLLFRLIYNYRSSFKHVHYTDEDGYKRIKKFRTKDYLKARNEIIGFYKESLEKFLPLYKRMFN